MKKITVSNYKKDKYYNKVINGVTELLNEKNYVSPVDLFIKLGNLKKDKYEEWRFGRINYLEKVIEGNLSKINRILRILKMHASILKLKPSITVYNKWGKSSKSQLRFTKNMDPNLEKAYSTHYILHVKESP